ncbi:F-box domain, Leucine-rich repeat domain, L domain-like protein [Artemisia annua]|uniref:F-box domain, Leucine-rich repeat domain, L domain-like protein n=1 Tax=Artemisia annua TaxID=35608 RepID=A0A2U1NW86_ARTAN|nr:F-box domain, Leucine-rich repeat domain, L domain-like protein [Artemisia annua]
MNNITKSHAADDSSSFTHLPDEMVLEILSKLIDFKTLCLCKLVSKRFCSIVHQVNTLCISSSIDASWECYWSAMLCLEKFGRLKSLCIQLPSFFDKNHLLFNWKIKCGNGVDSFIFLSPNSVYQDKQLYVKANGHQEDEAEELDSDSEKHDIAHEWLEGVFLTILLLMNPITNLPLLEDVAIADSFEKGRVSLNGEKVAELRNLPHSFSDVTELLKHYLNTPRRLSCCYVPLLELPFSGYVMKGVTLYIMGRNDLPAENFDSFMNIDLNDFKDKKEAAYSEAVMEILKKHRGDIKTIGTRL